MQNAKLIADGNPKKEKKNKYDKRKRKTFRTFSAYFVCKSVAKNQTKTKKQKMFFLFFTLHVSLKGQHKTLTHTHKHTTEEPLRSRCISYQKIRNCLQLCNYALGPNDGEI